MAMGGMQAPASEEGRAGGGMNVQEVQFDPHGGLTSEGLEYQAKVFGFYLRPTTDQGLFVSKGRREG